jgi:TadE-like protein
MPATPPPPPGRVGPLAWHRVRWRGCFLVGRQAARPGAGRSASAAGSATVELAAAVPLLVAMTMAMVGLLGLARDQVLAQGAAREGAREAALGGDWGRAAAAAHAALPSGRAARVTVVAAGSELVRVRVQLPVRLPFGVPLVTVSATAVAASEPGPAPAPAGP